MNTISNARIKALLISTAVLVPAQAHGQTEGAAEQASDLSSSVMLEEIIVTAQKRAQRFEDVGLTVNVVTGSELKSSGTESIVDLGGITPNVQIKNVLANSITNVSIRGIGLNDYAVNNNPAAGIYVDNVYLVSPAMLGFSFFDIDRVEVLKGPQGDLYGRNTTAGAINIISRKPSDETDVMLEAGYANYDNWHFEGAVGGALSSNLTARFALQTVQQASGWQTNYVTGERIGKVDRTNARLQMEYKPSDSLDILLSAHKGYDRSDVALYKANNALTTEEDPYAADARVAGAGNDPHMELDSSGLAVTVNWSLTPEVSMISISAYEEFSRIHVEDTDGSSFSYLDATYDNDVRQYSQELRFNYSAEDLELIGGGFYSYDKVQTRDEFYSPDLLPLLGLTGLDIIGNSYRQRTDAYAAFMHAEWTFAPRLTLIGGLRYTHENKVFDEATTFLCAAGACSNVFAPVSNDYSTSNVSGKIGLNYKLAEQTLIYANISRGFKSGGFQGQLTFDPSVLQPFDDEKLTAYELGVKSRPMPNLQLNASVFHYDYSDMQIYGPLFDSPVGVLFGIANVGDARVTGAEADIWWRPVAGLDLRFGVGTIDTEVTKSIVAGVTEGSVLPNAPKLTLNGLVRYNWDVSDDMTADFTLSGKYQSKVRFDIVRLPTEAMEDGYFTGNAEFGLSFGEQWRLSVWGKNIFNKLFRTQALNTSVGWTEHYGAARTFGVNLSYKM
jgi:iron complex outermembrane receptor protein